MIDRFLDKIHHEPNSGCWLWIGTVNNSGYGTFSVGKHNKFLAHRYSYEQQNGAIPNGLDLDHLCRMRCCVNPAHLEPVTRSENLLRGVSYNGSKTHCKNGHPYNEENTYFYPNRNKRACRICVNENQKQYQKRKKAEK